jgi:hypothetical protein
MKTIKTLALISILAIGITQSAFASWWNPLAWFQKREVSVQQVQKNTSSINNELVTESSSTPSTSKQEQKNFKNCFNEGPLAANVDKSNWKTFEGFGFAVQYPAEAISITPVGNPYNGGEFGFEISSLSNPHKTTIKVHRLRRSTYRAQYMHSPSVIYELYSNTWWRDEYIWDPSKSEQCNPNHRAKTDDEKYFIYSTNDGDVGISVINYFVVMRDIVKNDNYEPLVVSFITSSDGNDPSHVSYPAFESVLENIIKTLELRPTSKG